MSVTISKDQLKNASLFQDFSDDVLEELATQCHIVELAAGDTLFQQDVPGEVLYILEEGQIHIVRKYPTGEEVVLATEGPYYVIGELSMLAGLPRTGGVVAVSDCSLIAVDRQAFMDVCERVPEVAGKVIVYLSQRLYQMNLLVREHAIGNVAARVASMLVLLSGGEPGEIPARIRVSRIARAVAIDADSVERILNEWVDAGHIEFAGRKIKILDAEAIRNIAG